MYFSINLATRTYLDRRLVNRVGAALFLLLFLVLAWNMYRAAWGYGELRRLKDDVTSYEARLNSRPNGVSEKEYTQLLGTIGFYNEIIARKSFNWMGLLEQLENATPEGIALSVVSPDRKSGEIKIEGRAKSFTQLKSYLDKLEDSKYFSSILLLSHANIAVGERTKGVQFSLSCKAVLL
jgi:type IV pilus assembly protein PilN